MDKINKISAASVVAIFAFMLVIACVKLHFDNSPPLKPIFTGDYNFIKARGKIRIALIEGISNYCLYNARTRGFNYELALKFAKDHELELEVVLVRNRFEAEKALTNGHCDIIINQKPGIEANSVVNSHFVLLTHKNAKSDTIHCSADNFTVPPYQENAIYIKSQLNSEQVARKVANGRFSTAILDSSLARSYEKAFPQLYIDTSICIANTTFWHTHTAAVQLTDSINTWLSHYKTTKDYYQLRTIYHSYIDINVASNYYSPRCKQISRYDKLIMEIAKQENWDWCLIVALIYEESRFHKDISNPSGAYGLMQLMPDAYRKFAKDSTLISQPRCQIEAGIKYLSLLRKSVPNEITDSTTIVKYTLLCYNAGIGHAGDAYKLAKKYTRKAANWKNIATYMSLLNEKKYYNDSLVKSGRYNGKTAVKFVENIVERYRNYRNLAAIGE